MLASSSAVMAPEAGRLIHLSSVFVNEVPTRYAQEVRNHLIFALHGGAKQPAKASYRLNLSVDRSVASVVEIQEDGMNEPTAGAVTLTGSYSLVDTGTGETLVSGRQELTSSFDRPSQEYAVLRAERNAENRSARELAELLYLSIAQDLVRVKMAGSNRVRSRNQRPSTFNE